jgi:LmbE family N-acetylglucosaminyl deacetylase
MLRLLCVTAHPDDEAGSFGGTLRLYAERGVETHIWCLTPGQAATHRGGYAGEEELAAVRRREFAASCQILKVSRGEVLDYPDAALDRCDFYTVVSDLTERIRRLRPDVMMTYGPEGAVTAHTDHGMASLFATAAFQWAARTNRYPEQLKDGLTPHRVQKLYYATSGFVLPERQPVALSPWSAVIEIGEHLETKIRAFKAHTTQAPLFALFETMVRKRGTIEMFHLAASAHPQPAGPENDLFAGITGDDQK